MEKKTIMHYTCNWCKNSFDREIGTINKVSDQVQCSNCDNFLKTFGD